ncbi:hypothetical protein G3M48_006734 [Beauveria asiatica]|uniref:Uncharacterized protein n=1 Tax=Beauveria asiatica TaxID=1069075 RepID=A0AAW0RNI7_9HYPO
MPESSHQLFQHSPFILLLTFFLVEPGPQPCVCGLPALAYPTLSPASAPSSPAAAKYWVAPTASTQRDPSPPPSLAPGDRTTTHRSASGFRHGYTTTSFVSSKARPPPAWSHPGSATVATAAASYKGLPSHPANHRRQIHLLVRGPPVKAPVHLP